MKAIALILCSPVVVPVAVVLAFVRVGRFGLRQWRMQEAAKAATEQHREDLRAELAHQRAKLAEGMRRSWGAN
jgi:hypothetical protein